jgi:hypothetical protein
MVGAGGRAANRASCTVDEKVLAARAALRPAGARPLAALFASAVSVARYREAVALARARIASLDRSRRTPGKILWIWRIVGLVSISGSVSILYGLTLGPGNWYVALVLCILAVCGALFGVPLLVTGRVRQEK